MSRYGVLLRGGVVQDENAAVDSMVPGCGEGSAWDLRHVVVASERELVCGRVDMCVGRQRGVPWRGRGGPVFRREDVRVESAVREVL